MISAAGCKREVKGALVTCANNGFLEGSGWTAWLDGGWWLCWLRHCGWGLCFVWDRVVGKLVFMLEGAAQRCRAYYVYWGTWDWEY